MDYRVLISNNSGFTLIEVILTGVLLSICGIGVAGIFYAFNQEIGEGTAQSILQMQSETVNYLLDRDMREGSYVLQTIDSHNPAVIATTADADNITEIEIWSDQVDGSNQLNLLLAKYQISGGVLQKYNIVQSQWQDIKTGNRNITVTSGSKFLLLAGRRKVRSDLQLTLNNNGKTFLSAAIPGGTLFTCWH